MFLIHHPDMTTKPGPPGIKNEQIWIELMTKTTIMTPIGASLRFAVPKMIATYLREIENFLLILIVPQAGLRPNKFNW